jgi:hypothetical protein
MEPLKNVNDLIDSLLFGTNFTINVYRKLMKKEKSPT